MKNLLLFSAFLFLFSCQNESQKEKMIEKVPVPTKTETTVKPIEKTSETTDITPTPPNSESVIGIYVGMFEAAKYNEAKKPTWENKINVTIDNIENNKIIGHSVVAGNSRPFEGTVEYKNTPYRRFIVKAKEPGDDRYDGIFTFTIDINNEQITGLWDANNKKLAVTQRSYKLKKTTWKYNPNVELENLDYTDLYATYNDETGYSEFLTEDVQAKNPSTEKLTKTDVENMHKGDLEVMRNAIYARHGYTFKNRKMRYVFNHIDWYVPMFTDIRSKLTDLEKENIALMKRYEQHAERYYDSFGR